MIPAIVPGLIQGGLSFLSGKLGNDAAKKQARLQIIENNRAHMANITTQDLVNKHNAKLGQKLLKVKEQNWRENWSENTGDVDVDGMMAAAEKAGINPITFIRNGGLAAFARTSSHSTDHETRKGHNAVAAFQMMMPGAYMITPNNVGPQGGSAQALAGGLADGFRAYMDQANRNDAQEFQREMLNTQLSAMQQRDAYRGSRSFYVPGFSTSGGTISSKGSGGLSSMPTPGDRTATNPFPVGSPVTVNPRLADAEQAESRYGDIAQEFFGIANLIGDAWYNLKNSKWFKDQMKFVGGLSMPKVRKDLQFDALGNVVN